MAATESGGTNATNGQSAQHAGESASAPRSKWCVENMRSTFRKAKSYITVEPILLFYIMPSALSTLATTNLNLEKACRVNLNFTAETCDNYTRRNFPDNDTGYAQVSSKVAEMQVWSTPIESSIPLILILFVGSWSDRRHRRKPFMLTPLLGEVLTAVGLFFCSVYFLEWPLEAAGVIESLFPALSGGYIFLSMSVFSYVADVTTVETRTFRIGLLNIILSCAAPIAFGLSGFMYEGLGLQWTYVLIAAAYILGFVYGWFNVREPRTPVPRPPGTTFIDDFFNWRHVRETIKIGLRKRPNSGRLRLLLVVGIYVCSEGPWVGEGAVSMLFTFLRFHWGNEEVGVFSSYAVVIGVLGDVAVTLLASRLLKLDDCTIGMIAQGIKIVTSPLYAFASKGWHLYLLTVVTILGNGDLIVMRSLATKLVDEDEQGQVMAILGVVEAVIPLIFTPLYSQVYSSTLSVLPGTYFFISMVLSIIGFCLFLALYILESRNNASKENEERISRASQDGVANSAFQDDQHDAHTNVSESI